jgi:predicted aldo/keto reductase-like oxidoreductase
MGVNNIRRWYIQGNDNQTVPTLKVRSFEKMTASFISTLKHLIKDHTDIVHFHAFGHSMFCFIPRLLGESVVQGHGLEWK